MTVPSRETNRPLAMRALSDDHGGIAIMSALIMPVLVGGMALGAETGSWYMKQRKLQHAADLAAYAAAVRLMQGDTKDEASPAARHVADRSGYTGTDAGFTLNTPYNGDKTRVEVILTENQPRYLTAVFGPGQVGMSGRAVAKYKVTDGSRKACVLALSPQALRAVTVSGSTQAKFDGCEVFSNSNSSEAYYLGGSGQMSTDCVGVVGGGVATAGLTLNQCAAIQDTQKALLDPYKDVSEPAIEGPCGNKGGQWGTPNGALETISPNHAHSSGYPSRRFCNGLALKGPVKFEPGLYIIENGEFRVQAGEMTQIMGTGVTFYIAPTASINLNGQAVLNISPPSPTTTPAFPDTYYGILFFGSRSGTAASTLNGGNGTTIEGAVYMPGTALNYSGSSNAAQVGGCTQLVASTINFIGNNSSLGGDCEGLGGETIYTSYSAALIE